MFLVGDGETVEFSFSLVFVSVSTGTAEKQNEYVFLSLSIVVFATEVPPPFVALWLPFAPLYLQVGDELDCCFFIAHFDCLFVVCLLFVFCSNLPEIQFCEPFFLLFSP